MRRSERFPRAGFTLFEGFTLLEVMAAVVVLGLVYVVVAQGAMQGLQTEGDASRRLRASLLADRVLSDIELGLARGSPPPLGQTETSEQEFTVVVEVGPFDLATLLESASEQQGRPTGSTSELELLKPSRGGGTPTVLSIAVRVIWTEGISEQQVTRESFAFDLEAAAPLLGTIQPTETREEEEDQRVQGRSRQPNRPATLRAPSTRGESAQ